MKIGELIRARLLQTSAPTVVEKQYQLYSGQQHGNICTGGQCICASACFLTWAGGVERKGWAIFLHRPRDASGAFGAKPAAQASEQYRYILSQIDDYLQKMEVPLSVIGMMHATPSNDIVRLPFELAINMETPPSIHEWLIPDCGAMTAREAADRDKLGEMRQYHPEYLGYENGLYLNQLDNKYNMIQHCSFHKLYSERSRLAREAPLARPRFFLGPPEPNP
jgi:hypothetical protein